MNNSHAVEIIGVGTELLLGGTTNTDARDISEMLTQLGINVFYHTVVGDNPARLRQVMDIAMKRADIIITTGGLGPTCDDLTKNIIAEALGRKLVYNEAEGEKLKEYFVRRQKVMTDNNLQQVYLPEGCIVLSNDWGTAPGCIVEDGELTVIMLPGPPHECNSMMRHRVMPYLESKSGGIIVSHNYQIFGMGESEVEHLLRDEMNSFTNPTIAPYAKRYECYVRVTAKADTEEQAEEMIKPVGELVKAKLGNVVYGTDLSGLDRLVMDLLLERGMTLSAAESCTGGLLAKRMTDFPGASAVFVGGVVSYTNEMKMKVLGVKPETLEQYTVYSEEVAKEMAEGVKALTGSDLAVSLTGLAGPDGDGVHDVGTVCIGLATPEETITAELHIPGKNRDHVRMAATQWALDMVRRYLTGVPLEKRTNV
ncbi:MAG: competence/damage-inducible protein A [Oscillospiraceae bacterium]|nr:competence/damage-inducible protein A [Oscillospiraceae bacterium]